MEYISAEEFLKQPKEVEEVFIDWWSKNKTISDIATIKINKEIWGVHILSDIDLVVFEIGKDLIPLLTEGQLRKFIEDKTECKICLEYYKTTGYEVLLSDIEHNKENAEQFNNWYEDLGRDLLQAYWKVACEIAKEG